MVMIDLSKVHPELKESVNTIIKFMTPKMKITCAFRDPIEQERLFNIGRNGKSTKTVTNALPWKSYHNYGLAIDLCFEGYDPYPNDNDLWETFGLIAKKNGLVWGGEFKMVDRPHVQLDVNLPLTVAKSKWETLCPDLFFKWIDGLRGKI